MYSKKIFIVTAILLTFSHAFPAPIKRFNPWPAKEPTITFKPSNLDTSEISSPRLKARSWFSDVFDTIKDVGGDIVEAVGTSAKDLLNEISEDFTEDAKNFVNGRLDIVLGPIEPPPCEGRTECQSNDFIFDIDMAEFIDHRTKGLDSNILRWDADACSVPPTITEQLKFDKDVPFGNNFTNSCFRHDFGYRNFKTQRRFTDDNREKLDLQFRKDMFDQCTSQFSPLKKIKEFTFCQGVAEVYYGFVRLCGGGDCTLKNALDLVKGAISKLPRN